MTETSSTSPRGTDGRRGPLNGIRILDFTQALAGPIATMMLADLGADVVKVEPPGLGDHVRAWTRPDLNGLSPYFIGANRNKRAIVIDLKSDEGRELALQLVDTADLIVENFRPGTMDKLGLGWDVIHARNPHAIYCSVSGYGSDGPYANRAAYDLLIQAESGVLSVTGRPDGELAKIGVPAIDATAAFIAGFSMLAALMSRGPDGVGERLDISMLEVGSVFMSTLLIDFAITGRVARPMGTGNQLLAPYQVYETATAKIVLGVLSEKHWHLFCKEIDRLDLREDSRFATAPVRVENRDALNDELVSILRENSAEYWIDRFGRLGLACGFVNDVGRLLTHPQHAARDFIDTVEIAGLPVRLPRAPWRLGSVAGTDTLPPERGEHTDDVLGDWLGLPKDVIGGLVERGAIRRASEQQ